MAPLKTKSAARANALVAQRPTIDYTSTPQRDDTEYPTPAFKAPEDEGFEEHEGVSALESDLDGAELHGAAVLEDGGPTSDAESPAGAILEAGDGPQDPIAPGDNNGIGSAGHGLGVTEPFRGGVFGNSGMAEYLSHGDDVHEHKYLYDPGFKLTLKRVSNEAEGSKHLYPSYLNKKSKYLEFALDSLWTLIARLPLHKDYVVHIHEFTRAHKCFELKSFFSQASKYLHDYHVMLELLGAHGIAPMSSQLDEFDRDLRYLLKLLLRLTKAERRPYEDKNENADGEEMGDKWEGFDAVYEPTGRFFPCFTLAEKPADIMATVMHPRTQHANPPVTAKAPRKAYQLLASPVLSRPPLLTRELTSFEKAFYLYQKRLNERLALPFTRYFYYKEGTPSDAEWKSKIRARKTAARDIGVYSAYGDEGWNDEVLVGDKTAERQSVIEALVRDAEGKNIVEDEPVGDADKEGMALTDDARAGGEQRRELTKAEVERPVARVTEADRTNDMRSLSRKMDRTLYLLVKNREGRWIFPQDRVYGKENLHQAAERILVQAFGINMNTWIVGNHPIGHHHMMYTFGGAPAPRVAKIAPNPVVSTSQNQPGFEQEEYGEKVFFMKGRMMTGQADLGKNVYGDSEFRWLAKEEVKQVVTGGYWKSVRNMLVER
ncbi:hypothetical protein B0A55_07048 [Friedmanniomyces simplex]|uniref:Large ribosomal subunit protein mL46 n=1 Tax=Friedmanniomyces simplex TaxID=329884 RepID=A0A4U0X8T5_9PEZI|nr:hypothetical protein B0A55_07048 [Friedmanniomyces simplex]